MFFALNQFGSERLRRIFETLPIDSSTRLHDTAKFLDVSDRTLSSWLTGKTDPPRAAVYALWHESPLGHAVTSEHHTHAAHLWRTLAKSQAAQVKTLESKIDALHAEIDRLKAATLEPVAMNEPFFKRY